jgi:hypothetical protein
MLFTICANGVHRHAALHLQPASLEVLQHVLAPRVPQPGGVVEVGLHQDAVARDVGVDVRPLARVVEQVVQLDLHRRVLERQPIVHELERRPAAGLLECVRGDRMLPCDQRREERFVGPVRDNRQSLGNRRTKPSGMIEVVVRDDRPWSAASG